MSLTKPPQLLDQQHEYTSLTQDSCQPDSTTTELLGAVELFNEQLDSPPNPTRPIRANTPNPTRPLRRAKR